MTSETPLREALHRAARIQGMFVGDLARELDDEPNLRSTGWIGDLIEKAVAGTKDELESSSQDLSRAGVEIKSFGVGKGGRPTRPWEDLRLRRVNYAELCDMEPHESSVLAKMRVSIMVPYWRAPELEVAKCRCQGIKMDICRLSVCSCTEVACECSPWCPCRGKASGDKDPHLERIFIMPAFVWVPSEKAVRGMLDDIARHSEKVRAGGEDPLGGLGDNFGAYLRAATQGATGATNWVMYQDANGTEHRAKGRAWMLRARKLEQICEESMPGPWHSGIGW